jgi:hypothetical protein
VEGDPGYIRGQVSRAVVTVVATQALSILLVSLLVLVLFYRAAVRRILALTEFTASLSPDSLDVPLEKGPGTGPGPCDELDDLAVSVDTMRETLSQAFARRKAVEEELLNHRQNLEVVVEERTLSLKAANERLRIEIEERGAMEKEREQLITDLRLALGEVKKLSGLLPICSHCKKIRDDQGYWKQLESYIEEHSEAAFSHGICHECLRRYYPGIVVDGLHEPPGS